ncbi:putative ribonuclease H-like domain-containing protein [Tanacetum coccineum]|uniref:Ribonuclease H-like domain-containing protein n=1 Tax=Tanacetum coccineum TaxID=301880 RepID=A0ABQ5HHW9_9ASTR
MQKAVLKLQFKAFTISSSEGLEKGYDRFQQLLSQLEAHGAEVSTEDANHKFLRSLPSAWSNLAITMRAKLDVDTLSIDDLYNNLRVFEQELTSTSKSSTSAQNVAFVSQSKSSTNKHLREVPKNKATSTNSVNSGSGQDNTQPAHQDDSDMPELTIFNKPQKGIFDEISYDDEGLVQDFNNLPIEVAEEPKKISEALKDDCWVEAIQEELLQFRLQQVWILVDLPHGAKVIGKKWVYRNKRDERGVVVRNKARLVAQGHRQEEGIDYDEVFAPVARIKAIRLFLAFASFMGFIVYQMDVKSAFLYGIIDEEVFVSQLPCFVDPAHPKKVYKVVKALYGLHQAPRAWYATLSTFLERHGYRRGTIDKTLFIKKDKKDIMLVQVYVDDIIFGSTRKSWCDEFEALMKDIFQMRSMGELIFFLGLQVKQKTYGIFISQHKYVADMLKKFDLAGVKTAITPMEAKMALTQDEEADEVDVTPKTSHLNAVKRIFKYLKGKPNLGLWYPRESSFDLEAFSDSDYAGANLDRKSTTGGCQFLGSRLISWQCKKQTIVATSTTEAEYVAAASCCGQVLWIQNQMLDYGFNFMNTKIHIDNESTICIVKNPVYHSKTKHIEIRHHFIRDSYEKKLIRVEKIHTDFNVADLLTKAFDGPRFNFLVVNIGQPLSPRQETAVPHSQDPTHPHVPEARTMTVEDLLHLVPNLITKVDSLETELKQTKLTMGKAIVQLVKKVKKLEDIIKRRHVVLTDSEVEELKDQGRIIQDIIDDPLVSKGDFATPTKPSGEAREEEISPTTLEAAKTLSKVASQRSKSVDKGKRYKMRKESKGKDIDSGFGDISTGLEHVNTDSEEVNTDGLGVSTSSGPVSSARGQREGKAPMVEEGVQATQKIKEQIRQEEASLAEAIRLQTLEEEETAKQVHLDALLAKRLTEVLNLPMIHV